MVAESGKSNGHAVIDRRKVNQNKGKSFAKHETCHGHEHGHEEGCFQLLVFLSEKELNIFLGSAVV